MELYERCSLKEVPNYKGPSNTTDKGGTKGLTI